MPSTRLHSLTDDACLPVNCVARSHQASALDNDPFHEQRGEQCAARKQLLGGMFHFRSNSRALLDLVEAAYGGLPAHVLPPLIPECRIDLRLVSRAHEAPSNEPPPVRTQAGAGLLCGVIDACNYVIIEPGQQRALIVVSQDMLAHAYHMRYELIEFAVFLLASRVQGLIPLHGACVGRHGRGVLLLGASGSGKSTLALHSLLRGLDFLAEDAVFVQSQSLLATGVANFVHVQSDGLRFVDDHKEREWLSRAPVIRRRSGVQKHEADLRRGHGRLAMHPLELVGAVFVSPLVAESPASMLKPVPESDLIDRLVADQPYASGQPGWHHFAHQLMRLGVHELRRGRHPQASVDALEHLLK